MRTAVLCVCAAAAIVLGAGGGYYLWDSSQNHAASYEADAYTGNLYQGGMFAQDLCVTSGDVSLEGYEPETSLHAAGLFDLSKESVLCGYRIFEPFAPASTTKVMTAYVALKYGNLDDVVTVSENAAVRNWDESVCNLQTGDTLTMYDLLCGMLLHSGNDCAVAIAEHVSGSEEAFVELMNEEAAALGATGTHFMNPHGLHDENHYTTAYDLYLMFNACMKDERFADIISMDTYNVSITQADGTVRIDEWPASNYYSSGEVAPPDGVKVIGGKTGTTDEAGNCLIIYDEDLESNPYISVIMGAGDRTILYEQMNQMLSSGVTGQ